LIWVKAISNRDARPRPARELRVFWTDLTYAWSKPRSDEVDQRLSLIGSSSPSPSSNSQTDAVTLGPGKGLATKKPRRQKKTFDDDCGGAVAMVKDEGFSLGDYSRE
jgi:hypothetical protein